jgi:hypothetical protein
VIVLHDNHSTAPWCGAGRSRPVLYWEKLEAFGLTMAPLEPAV